MAEQLTELDILQHEKEHTGTSWTRNEFFDANGYYVVKNLYNPEELYSPVPEQKGLHEYRGPKGKDYIYFPLEQQVEGSTSRYWWPEYKEIHSKLRIKLENIIGRKLYNTYYYDRFYNQGQELKRHVDRPACEISVTIHVSTNLEGEDANWPIWIKTPDTYTDETKSQILIPGENKSVILNPGDGMIYKGCERPHWRYPMPTPKQKKSLFKKIESKEYYYHQVFFHYVLADGIRSHFANDSGR